MKKLAITLAIVGLLAGTTTTGFAQGTVGLNNFDSFNPIYYLDTDTQAPADGSTYVQLLGGPDASSLAPVTNPDGTSIFNLVAPGFFDGGIGTVADVEASAEGSFQLRAWRDAATYEDAAGGERGASEVWTQLTGTPALTEPAPVPASPEALDNPGVVIVPEPSTILLGLLGGAALLFRRRK